jgi:hypothetical protein
MCDTQVSTQTIGKTKSPLDGLKIDFIPPA